MNANIQELYLILHNFILLNVPLVELLVEQLGYQSVLTMVVKMVVKRRVYQLVATKAS